MSTARRTPSAAPIRDPKKPAPSGQYRMVTPRTVEMPAVRRPRRISNDYLETSVGLVGARDVDELPPLELKRVDELPVTKKSSRPAKAIEIDVLDDAFEDEVEDDAADSLVQLMEGTRVREEAWPKEKDAWPKDVPPIPRPPSVPKMEAVRPPTTPTALPISRATPSPLTEEQVIEAFAKWGPAPTSLWQTPAYALHVRARKRALSDELGLTRQRRSSDVALYEKALRQVDDGAVRRGLMLMASTAVLGALLVSAILSVLL